MLASAGFAQPQEPPNKPWAFRHPRFTPEAQAILKEKCQTEAGEVIHSIVDDVRGVLREDEPSKSRQTGPRVGAVSLRQTGATGVAIDHIHPKVMFFQLGLSFVEWELSELDKAKTKKSYGRFDLRARSDEYVDLPKSTVSIRFVDLLGPEERQLGLWGRRIEVRSRETLLAARTEFFWKNPEIRGWEIVLCPALQGTDGQASPMSFLSRVINARSYGCFAKTEQESVTTRAKSRELCDRNYWENR
jgi:hypothetical protein